MSDVLLPNANDHCFIRFDSNLFIINMLIMKNLLLTYEILL